QIKMVHQRQGFLDPSRHGFRRQRGARVIQNILIHADRVLQLLTLELAHEARLAHLGPATLSEHHEGNFSHASLRLYSSHEGDRLALADLLHDRRIAASLSVSPAYQKCITESGKTQTCCSFQLRAVLGGERLFFSLDRVAAPQNNSRGLLLVQKYLAAGKSRSE